jgi:hypothetical protein
MGVGTMASDQEQDAERAIADVVPENWSPPRRVFEHLRVYWPWYAMGVSVPSILASWLASYHGHYGGFPVNVIGQIMGDVLLAGAVAPFARRAYQRQTGREHKAGFPYERFLRHIAGARHRIQLLDTFSFMLLPSNGDHTGIPGAENSRYHRIYRQRLVEALKRDVVIEILLLRPDSPEVGRRASALNISSERYERLVERNLEVLRDLHREVPEGKLDVRTYDAPPVLTLHRCDDRMWTSFYPLGDPAVNSPHLELDSRSQNGWFLKKRFTEVYDKSVRVW